MKTWCNQHLYRRRLCHQRASNTYMKLNNARVINFASSDYLGLSTDTQVKQLFANAAQQHGISAGGSPLIDGYHTIHRELELACCEQLNRPAAIVMPSGYQANIAIIQTLSKLNRKILIDKHCHASFMDGLHFHKRYHRYAHQNITHLKNLLASSQDTPTIITESIFSMTGEITALDQINSLATSSTVIIVDDAHGFGVLGKNGLGCQEYFNLPTHAISLLMTTFSKAAGSTGAVISGAPDLIEAIIQFGRSYGYTVALPPAIAAANLALLKIIQQQAWRREKLTELALHFNSCARNLNLPLLNNNILPIKIIELPNNLSVLNLQQQLLQKGYYVSAIRPPSAPTPRLRVMINAQHTLQQITHLTQLLTNSITNQHNIEIC